MAVMTQETTELTAIQLSRIGYNAVSLTEWDTITVPEMAEGSLIEQGGSIFEARGGDLSVGNLAVLADGICYLYVQVDGTLIASVTPPVWVEDKNGWYNGTDRCYASVYKSAGSYIKKVIFLNKTFGNNNNGICTTLPLTNSESKIINGLDMYNYNSVSDLEIISKTVSGSSNKTEYSDPIILRKPISAYLKCDITSNYNSSARTYLQIYQNGDWQDIVYTATLTSTFSDEYIYGLQLNPGYYRLKCILYYNSGAACTFISYLYTTGVYGTDEFLTSRIIT